MQVAIDEALKLETAVARLRSLLLERAATESEPVEGSARLCYGTFLSRTQYRADVERFGLTDARHA